jgi:hypothetical protein
LVNPVVQRVRQNGGGRNRGKGEREKLEAAVKGGFEADAKGRRTGGGSKVTDEVVLRERALSH